MLQAQLATDQANRGIGLALTFIAFADHNLVAVCVDGLDLVVHDVFIALLHFV